MNCLEKVGKEFVVRIYKDKNYGCFYDKVFEDEYSGGLWFENSQLVDYDGISGYLPLEVAKLIEKLGFNVDLNKFCDA